MIKLTLNKKGKYDLVWSASSYLPFYKKQLITKYLFEAPDYKQYCELGKNNRIPKPPICPHCKRTDCLIGHGWYARKGLSGADCGFLLFWIRRFYCKTTGKTVSIHPGFSHTRKRYILQCVINCFVAILEKQINISMASLIQQVPRQTLKRWSQSFSDSHVEAKRICYRLTGPPQDILGHQILRYFRKQQNSTLSDNAAIGMICLFEEFYRTLY